MPVSITYVGNGGWGTGKGGPLTIAEADGNLYEIAQAITALEGAAGPAEIDQINVVGSQFSIVLSDNTTFGPYSLPRSVFAWRGDWAPSTQYYGNDIVKRAGSGVYLVSYDHVSPASFDAGFVASGESVEALQLMFSGDLDTVAEVSGATHTPAAAAPMAYYRCTDAGGCTITVPLAATSDIPIGARVTYVQQGGALAFTIESGVTVNVPASQSLATSAVGSRVELRKVGAEEFDAFVYPG